jgi:hypothetical protein
VGAALTKCLPFRGDVIAVMANNAWQYGDPLDGRVLPISEEVLVDIPGVRIVGINPSAAAGVVWMPASNGGTCITIRALDVLVEGFLFTEGTFTGCNAISGIWGGPGGFFGDNLTIRNCVFDDTVNVAIQLEYVWYAQIYHNSFYANDTYGIYVNPLGNGINFCEIFENILHNCAMAMALNGCDNSHIFNNSIYNAHAQGGAAATNEGIDTTGGASNQVFDNYFSCLLPVPGNGDWNDLNTAAATDAWIGNHCMNGVAVLNPT